jgi:Ca-activated chloride channel homolog
MNFLTIFAIAFALFSFSCQQQETATLRLMAGSELKDLEPLLSEIEKGCGIALKMKYIGTLDGAEKVVAGEIEDGAWFSHGKYLTLLQGNSGKILAHEKIMLSPVVMGVKQSLAKAWGWEGNRNVTWSDIMAKAESGELRYAMTNPAASNSGFTALVAVATSLSGTGDALRESDVKNTKLQAFFKGQQLTAGSSGWLSDAYVKEQSHLDGLVNYESVLIQLNRSGNLKEPLTLIYPKEGVITADYPIMLLNAEKRPAFDKLVAYLRTPEFQTKLMQQTQRRPAIPQVTPDAIFAQDLLELPFPNQLSVIHAVLRAYLDEQRIPSHAFYVLDISGSMEGDRIQELKTAMGNLSGLDQTLTGSFAGFSKRERITILPFHEGLGSIGHFQMGDTLQSDSFSTSVEELRQFVDTLQAGGGTAIFSALTEAYHLADQARSQDSSRYYSIVLMSDGLNREGKSIEEFTNYYQSLPPRSQNIKTFTVLFGDADPLELRAVAELTGGRSFDSRQESLPFIFKQIRGYQ